MSDTPHAAAKTDAPAGAAPAGPAGPVMIGIIVVALAVGVALGTLVLGPQLARSKGVKAEPAAAKSEGGGHGKEGKEGKEDKAAIYRVENIIVNPAGSEGSHFLMATVAIQLENEKREEALRGHEDEIRDHVISVLEKQTLESLSVAGARDTLRGRIATVLAPLIGSTDPSHIFLPQFVIQ